MKVLQPITVTDALLKSSSATEDDAPIWNEATTYAVGARVITPSTHKVWQSAVGSNTGHDPNTDFAAAWWLPVGSTRPWRAFDERIGARVSHTGILSYRVTAPKLLNAVALLRLASYRVRLRVYNAENVVIYDRTRELVDFSNIVDPLSMVTVMPDFTDFSAFEGFAALPGQDVLIEIGIAGEATAVGEIIIGQEQFIGRTLDGTSIGATDYSTKDRDQFGTVYIVPRTYSDNTTFEVAIPTPNAKKVKRLMVSLRARAALYYDDDADKYGTAVFGLARDFDIPMQSQGYSFANIEIEGLT